MWSKRLAVAALVCALVSLMGAAAFYFFWFPKHQGLREVKIGDYTVYVSVADTEASRQLGLGGRDSLPADEGMLFVFPVEGKFSFWMKDMRFPIDIIWIANDGKVIYIKDNVTPDTYPATFAPETGLARYVLEVPAGYVQSHGVDIGSEVSW